jgi:hypothetical protein
VGGLAPRRHPGLADSDRIHFLLTPIHQPPHLRLPVPRSFVGADGPEDGSTAGTNTAQVRIAVRSHCKPTLKELCDADSPPCWGTHDLLLGPRLRQRHATARRALLRGPP